MLKQRMITAAWLATVTLIGLFGLQGGAFALFTALIVLLGTWEWTNLAGVIVSRTRLALVAGMAVLMALLWLSGGNRYPKGEYEDGAYDESRCMHGSAPVQLR